MDVLFGAIVGIAAGLFGGVGLERYRYARKDHEHRQGYYHRLLAAADDYIVASTELDALAESGAAVTLADFEEGPYMNEDDMARLHAAVVAERQGIEVFGAQSVADAARELEQVMGGDRTTVNPARERLVKAMRRDVGPRQFGFGPRG